VFSVILGVAPPPAPLSVGLAVKRRWYRGKPLGVPRIAATRRRNTMKHMTAFLIGLILPVAVMTPVTDGARAEGFVDIRVGGAVTQDTDGTAKIGPAGGPPQLVSSTTVKFEAGVSVGVRGGYWLNSVPWLGLAFDLSYFDPDEDASEPVKFGVFPISGLLMLRYPLLKDSDYPRGRLQPYAGVGPGAFVTTARLDGNPAGTEVSIDTTVAAGLDVRGGVNFLFTGWESPGSLAIILEYRFTHFEPSDFKGNLGDLRIDLESDQWNTHHIVAGLGWCF
jgi:opacity protein-like surface antigen